MTRVQRWASVALALVVAATVVALALRPGDRKVVTEPPGAHGPGTQGVTSPIAHVPSLESEILVAVLRDQVKGATTAKPVLVLDHTCTNVMEAGAGPCHPQAIPAAVRTDIIAALNNRVRFIAQSPTTVNGRPVVTLGRIHDRVARAGQPASVEVPLQMVCGPLCGQGQTFVVTRTANGWKVTGTTGKMWIA